MFLHLHMAGNSPYHRQPNSPPLLLLEHTHEIDTTDEDNGEARVKRATTNAGRAALATPAACTAPVTLEPQFELLLRPDSGAPWDITQRTPCLVRVTQPLSAFGISKRDIDSFWALEPTMNSDVKFTGRYGKECTMHRKQIFHGAEGIEGYRFAKQVQAAHPLSEAMERLLAVFNAITRGYSKFEYNALLFNLYADRDELAQHSDDESGLNNDAGVIMVTLVENEDPRGNRTFRVTLREQIVDEAGVKHTVTALDHVTHHGEILWMKERQFQQVYKHGVLKAKKPRGALAAPMPKRLSITARAHKIDKKK